MFGSFSLRYLLLLFTISLIFSFRIRKLNKVKPLYAVDKWLLTGNEESQQKRTITVRFINNISGKDVVTEAEEGSILLAVGDRAGVKLPRACRTGLCGSCTCELQDPAAIATSTNPRDGFATIRACSYKCHIPEGMDEMVIDVYRMKNRAVAATSKTNSKVAGVSLVNDYVDPMARFSGDWEKEFRPQWELTKAREGRGLAGAASDPKTKTLLCTKCNGAGRVKCYACNGRGTTLMGTGLTDQCATCVGRLTVGCGSCRGTGNKKIISRKEKNFNEMELNPLHRNNSFSGARVVQPYQIVYAEDFDRQPDLHDNARNQSECIRFGLHAGEADGFRIVNEDHVSAVNSEVVGSLISRKVEEKLKSVGDYDDAIENVIIPTPSAPILSVKENPESPLFPLHSIPYKISDYKSIYEQDNRSSSEGYKVNDYKSIYE